MVWATEPSLEQTFIKDNLGEVYRVSCILGQLWTHYIAWKTFHRPSCLHLLSSGIAGPWYLPVYTSLCFEHAQIKLTNWATHPAHIKDNYVRFSLKQMTETQMGLNNQNRDIMVERTGSSRVFLAALEVVQMTHHILGLPFGLGLLPVPLSQACLQCHTARASQADHVPKKANSWVATKVPEMSLSE